MTKIYSLDKLDPIAVEAIRGSTARAGIYVTPTLIRRFKGDGNTTIIFKRLLYCSEQWGDEQGWFFQTAGSIEKVTGLGNKALQRSISRLAKMGLIEKTLKGMPRKTHYRINLTAYLALIEAEASLATSDEDEASLSPSDDDSVVTSSDDSVAPNGEESLANNGKQVVLSDSTSDTQSDTYPPIGEETESPKPESIFQPGDDQLTIAAKCKQKQDKAGGNIAVPPEAGGVDVFADGPVDAFASVLAGIAPADLPAKRRKSWARKLRQIAEEWSTEGNRITVDVMERAIRAVPESDIKWKTYKSPYSGKFEEDIGALLLSGGQQSVKVGY